MGRAGRRIGSLLFWLSILPRWAEAADVDLILALDNSASMFLEASALESTLNAFAAALSSAGDNVRIVAISADSSDPEGICAPAPLGSGSCPADQNLPGYRHIVQSVGSFHALSLILSQHPAYASSLRSGSSRHILVVSDDNSSLSAASFASQLIALDADFAGFGFHAIVARSVAPPPPPENPCTGVVVGQVYIDLVASSGGTLEDLCDQQIPESLDRIAAAIAFPAGPQVPSLPQGWPAHGLLVSLLLVTVLARAHSFRGTLSAAC